MDERRLQIRWQLKSDEMDIYLSETPSAFHFDRPALQVRGTNQVVFDCPDPERRYYFALVGRAGQVAGFPWVVAERIIPLEGGFNLRDLGGYPAAGGRRVCWGQVYRSGDLASLSERDRLRLANMGFRLVCDLRTGRERSALPDKELAGAASQSVPVYPHANSLGIGLQEVLFRRPELPGLFKKGYIEGMLETYAASFGEVLRHLADPGNRPFLFHCTAGKDRAGLTAALLLSALGVPRETVLADYSLSNLAYAPIAARVDSSLDRVKKLGITVETLQPMLVADPALLSAALEHLDRTYGSIEAYLVKRAGVSPETLSELRRDLIEP
jgi:protein-tyrosine phosphatase